MKQRLISCNLPEAIQKTKEGMVSGRSQLSPRHGLDMWAEPHPFGAEVVVYLEGDRLGSWPLAEAWCRTWGEVVEEPKAKPAK